MDGAVAILVCKSMIPSDPTKMKVTRSLISTVALIVIAANAVFPCGPGYVTPVFDNERAPESPYREFAAGNLGIIKPTYRRNVLLAAYRYLIGTGFSEPEQQALIEFWEAEINNKPYQRNDEIGTAVKAWIEQRKAVVGKEEKVPDIYVERTWGGYEFFPNCTKNAFETAAKTLSDRVASYGSDSGDVRIWVKTQDQVFMNCAVGRSIPAEPSADMAEWLRKDRAYQIAAAEFYALDYAGARRRFTDIAQDSDSPWRETAEYLIGRTLIRQASLGHDKTRSDALYVEADQALQTVAMKGGRFAADAERLLGVVRYRLQPAERMRELAQHIAYQGSVDFRQDLIDYTWLLDKYEKESLETEERRKAEEEARKNPASATPTPDTTPPANDPNKIQIYVWSEKDQQSYSFEIPASATDEDAYAAAEVAIGRPIDEKLREQVRNQRQAAYANRFTNDRDSGYQGGYWGSETMSRSLLPDAIRQDDLSDWLFTYQMRSPDAYVYSLEKLRETGFDLWAMTAISKAETNSPDLDALIDRARKVGASSPAFPTVAYHLARIDIARGRISDAKALLDELIASPLTFPSSTRNQYLKLRMTLADTIEDFFKYSLRQPYAFDFDGTVATLDRHKIEQKSWYSPEAYPDKTKEQYEKEIDERFAVYEKFASEKMLDSDAYSSLNRYFPTESLIAAEKLENIPKHVRQRLALAIWTRAVLLENDPAARQITPRLIEAFPELAESFKPYLAAATPVARKRAALFIILKNPILTPAIESGFDADNSFGEWDADNWWCEWFFDSENEDPSTFGPTPRFLTKAQLAAAKTERRQLQQVGDAPKFFYQKTLEWARVAPADKRVPEALYIAWASNGWTKYGCGNGPEIQEEIAGFMRARYPNSEWTKKLDETPEN